MGFHRLVTPTYNGGLPASYDLINDPVANGDAGVAAGVDGKKSSGANEGTYFAALTEPANSAFQNRGNAALAENCDILDDVVRTSRPIPAFAPTPTTFHTSAGESQREITGFDVFVGRSGVTVTQEIRAGLVQLVSPNDLRPVLNAIGTPIQVVDIRDNGDAGNIVGGEATGYHTAPIVVFSGAIPVAAQYRLLFLTRGTVSGESDPTDATGDMGYLAQMLIEASRWQDADEVPFTTQQSAWADGTLTAFSRVQEAIDVDVVGGLSKTTGSSGGDKIGIEAHTSALDAAGGYGIAAGTLHDHLEAIADRYLDSTAAEVGVWAGQYQYTSGGTIFEFLNGGVHIVGPSINKLNIQAGVGQHIWLRGPSGGAEFEVGDDQLQFFPATADGNLRVMNNVSLLTDVGLEINMNKDAASNGNLAITRTKRTGSGGFTSNVIHVIGQEGRDVIGGTDNDGGQVVVNTGKTGSGGDARTVTDEGGQHGAFKIHFGGVVGSGDMAHYRWMIKTLGSGLGTELWDVVLNDHGLPFPTRDTVYHVRVVFLGLTTGGPDGTTKVWDAGVYYDISLAAGVRYFRINTQTAGHAQETGGIGNADGFIQNAAAAGLTLRLEHDLGATGQVGMMVEVTAFEDQDVDN